MIDVGDNYTATDTEVSVDTYDVPYDQVLVMPSSVRVLVSRRSVLCRKHIEEYLQNYVVDMYNSLNIYLRSCIGWIIMSMYDLDLPIVEIIEEHVPGSKINDDKITYRLSEILYTILKDSI